MKLNKIRLDYLREQRNIGSKKVAELKRSGKSIDDEVLLLKEISVEIKQIENLLTIESLKKYKQDFNEDKDSSDEFLYDKLYSSGSLECDNQVITSVVYGISKELVNEIQELELKSGHQLPSRTFRPCELNRFW